MLKLRLSFRQREKCQYTETCIELIVHGWNNDNWCATFWAQVII
jgi:hypothetical protein